MNSYYFVVRVDCDTEDQAHRVMSERLMHDEDYGFDYEVDYTFPEEDEGDL